jgi:hypothetical protein
LVEARKQGLHVYYRLADAAVVNLSKAIHSVEERRLADFDRLVRQHFGDRADVEPIGMDDLLKRARARDVVTVLTHGQTA